MMSVMMMIMSVMMMMMNIYTDCINLVCLAVKHSLIFHVTASPGRPNVPEFMGAIEVDGVLVSYCDSNKKAHELKQDWMRKLFETDPDHLRLYNTECRENQPNLLNATMNEFKPHLNQSGGEYVLCYILCADTIVDIGCVCAPS